MYLSRTLFRSLFIDGHPGVEVECGAFAATDDTIEGPEELKLIVELMLPQM